MKNKSRILRTIFQFLMVIMLVAFLSNSLINNTFAVMAQDNPDVIINIDNKGKINQEGNLFGENSWYPGKTENGIIRIKNNFNTINVKSFGIQVNMNKAKAGYDEKTVKDSFLNNMKLSIIKGKISVFEKILIDSVTLGSLLFQHNDEENNGYKLEKSKQFNINKNNFIDLKYTLIMNDEAGDELEDMSADVSFLINIEGDSSSNDKDDDDDDDDDHDIIITDIEGHWAHNCIDTLLRHGIIQGYPDGTIRPQSNITRAETANLIGKALQLKGVNNNMPYIDSIPSWSQEYVNATTQLNIFKGYLDQTFKADNFITREEMTAVLIRAFGLELGEDIRLTFNDKDNISNWALVYIKTAVENGVIEGYPDGYFYPRKNITRAEACTIICKLLGLHQEHN